MGHIKVYSAEKVGSRNDLLKRATENISDHGAVKVDWLRGVIEDIPGHGAIKIDSHQKG